MSNPPTSPGDSGHHPQGPPPWPHQPHLGAPPRDPGGDPYGASAPPQGGGEGWWNLFESAATPPPPPPQQKRRRKLLIAGSAGLLAVLIVIAVVIISGTKRSDSPLASDEDSPTISESPEPSAAVADPRLLGMLPVGISEETCQPEVDNGAQPSIACDGSGLPGEPLKVTLIRAEDKAALNAVFKQSVSGFKVVLCPGNIQSPGPWRRNAAPQVPAGTLMCGYDGRKPVVAWTDEARLLVVVAEGEPTTDAMPALYRWWSSHS